MPRQLRSRGSRPNYAALHTGEDVEVYVPDPEEIESGSEFAANDSDAGGGADAQDENVEPEAESSEVGSDRGGGSLSKPIPQAKKPKPKPRGSGGRLWETASVGVSRPSKLAPPTAHHRHRPLPLFRKDGQVERLLSLPILFQQPAITLTNGFTSSTRTTKRLERSWGRNVGPGPVYEILEDRAWFKEATPDASVASEAGRRPVVYGDVKLEDKCTILSERSVF